MLPNTSLILELLCDELKKLITHFILIINLQLPIQHVSDCCRYLLSLYHHPPFASLPSHALAHLLLFFKLLSSLVTLPSALTSLPPPILYPYQQMCLPFSLHYQITLEYWQNFCSSIDWASILPYSSD
ncbi:hypothetical protein Tco_0323114, partial [Tanacetum coccineum]